MVSQSVSVKFSALYLVSKVSEKSGISPPLAIIIVTDYTLIIILSMQHYSYNNAVVATYIAN